MAPEDDDAGRFGALFRQLLEQVVHGPGSFTANRPGRVDQAVEIPLSDDAERRGLFQLYSREVPFADDDDRDDTQPGG